ncbi:serine peptidase DegS [Tibeticola sediminis]|uniref:Serine peptidase DegS n=1 Tax=Tibeticola sediminis TaxID=1917811 RepID=A0A3N4UJK4_9BURK|nr:trypsin-like peptidase domain-containing protein [Tibeticola sediminis]RPE67511.1 serine peptidase DegS [Tibeticola sediminis]
MKRLWLVFSQTVTVALALAFVVSTLKPQWMQWPLRASGGSISVVEAPPTPATEAPPGSLRGAARAASPAVVSISTSKAPKPSPHRGDPWFRFFFGERESQPQVGLGSGVIVSDAGYLLTNNHVIEGADEIEVALADGRRAPARVIGTDPDTDLAVLKITLDRLPAITLGQSESLAVGDIVLAIGNPFGVGQTVTAGIVSALGRSQLGLNTFENFIQTDAAINPGNSGGALVDVHGRLMGINTAIYSRSGGNLGIGFAIPVSTAREVMEAIVREGHVTRGWIGVEPSELSAELAQGLGLEPGSGVLVTGVLQDGPAARAGIQPGDVILRVEGKPVRQVAELLSAVSALRPGQPARLSLWRRGQTLEMSLTPGTRPPRPAE